MLVPDYSSLQQNKVEELPGVLGNRGIMSFISGEQGNNVIYFRGTGEHKSKNEGNTGVRIFNGLIAEFSGFDDFFRKIKSSDHDTSFEIWYFCWGRVGGMDSFIGFVELSFPPSERRTKVISGSREHRKLRF